MIPVDEARGRILAGVRPMPSERVPLAAALDRVLAEDVVADDAVPPWDNSAMDGYAVRSADLAPEGGVLRLLETIHAGEAPRHALTAGTASAIMTGAPMPEGADAVVIVEDSDGAREGEVTLREGATPGRHVRRRGADVPEGAVVLSRGTVLTPARLGLAASVGCTHLRVARAPRIAILTTGDEVVRPGEVRGPAQIRSSNHVTLAGLARQAGAVPVDAGHAPDDLDTTVALLRRALASADLVITTGGVSVGAADLVQDALRAAGVDVGFWKIRMRPGKPVVFGTATDGTPVVGLPGNPVSCMVGFLELVRPWVRASLGDPHVGLPTVRALVLEDLGGRPGRARFERVAVGRRGSRLVCRPAGDRSSGVLSSMAWADGLALVGPDATGPRAGQEVDVHLLDTAGLVPEDPALGW